MNTRFARDKRAFTRYFIVIDSYGEQCVISTRTQWRIVSRARFHLWKSDGNGRRLLSSRTLPSSPSSVDGSLAAVANDTTYDYLTTYSPSMTAVARE